MKSKKLITLIALSCAVLLVLSGCSSKIPDSTSEDWRLYLKPSEAGNVVVNDLGKEMEAYHFDKKGNIVDADKTIIIGASNVSQFTPVEDITVSDESIFKIELDSRIQETTLDEDFGSNMTSTSTVQELEAIEKTTRATLAITPVSATNGTLYLSVSAPDKITLTPVKEDEYDNATQQLKCNPVGGEVIFDFKCTEAGEYILKAESADGNCVKEFPITVTLNPIPVNEGQFQDPDEEFLEPETDFEPFIEPVTSETVTEVATNEIATTENTVGWIKGSKVNLREKMSTSSTVIETYKTGKEVTILGSANGWTKIEVDGHTGYVKTLYITEENPNATVAPSPDPGSSYTNTSQQAVTNPTYTYSNTNQQTQQNTAVNAPIASNDGYDHGYAYSTTAKPSETDHNHDYQIYEVVPATQSAQGYTVFKCSCGSTYKGCFTDYEGGDVHVHDYEAIDIIPSCTEPGYTEHTCACGDTYRDNFVNALGHSLTVIATEETPFGKMITYACSECGLTFTEEE